MRSLRVYFGIIIHSVLISGLYAQADFTAHITEGCTPMKVKFAIDESSVDMDTVNFITWNFGLGDTLNSVNPDTVIYQREGLYTVTMTINGFEDGRVIKTDFITVHRTLSSAFIFEEFQTGNNFRFIPLDEITDPLATYSFSWEYRKITSSDDRDNNYTITILNQAMAVDTVTLDTGLYAVTLNISDNYGCSSDFTDRVRVFGEIMIPNIFMPEIHEYFIIDPQNIGTVLHFQVFNRNGLLIFEQTAPIIRWDGRNNNGIDMNTGVFFYVLESVEGDPLEKFTQQGFIHLYRND